MVDVPNLDRMREMQDKTEAIHSFLEFAAEKGFVLTKHILSGWVPLKGGERRTDDDLVKLSLAECVYVDRTYQSIAVDADAYREFRDIYKDPDLGKTAEGTAAARKLVDERGYVSEPEFYDDIGTEGRRLDELLYAFIGVDPKKVDDEREALLDAHRQATGQS